MSRRKKTSLRSGSSVIDNNNVKNGGCLTERRRVPRKEVAAAATATAAATPIPSAMLEKKLVSSLKRGNSSSSCKSVKFSPTSIEYNYYVPAGEGSGGWSGQICEVGVNLGLRMVRCCRQPMPSFVLKTSLFFFFFSSLTILVTKMDRVLQYSPRDLTPYR